MKIGLYASMNNGDVFNKDIPYIAVDGGLEHLHRQSIKPLCAIGAVSYTHLTLPTICSV